MTDDELAHHLAHLRAIHPAEIGLRAGEAVEVLAELQKFRLAEELRFRAANSLEYKEALWDGLKPDPGCGPSVIERVTGEGFEVKAHGRHYIASQPRNHGIIDPRDRL